MTSSFASVSFSYRPALARKLAAPVCIHDPTLVSMNFTPASRYCSTLSSVAREPAFRPAF